MERFILDGDLDIEQPYPGGQKAHYDAGTPVAVNTSGRLYELIRDRLRPEDGRRRDQVGRAAVLLRDAADVPSPPGGGAYGISG